MQETSNSMKQLSGREIMQAVISGERAERIPGCVRLDPWYAAMRSEGRMPAELAGMTLEEVQEHLGFVRSARRGKVCEMVLEGGVEKVVQQEGEEIITEWRTEKGTLRRRERWTQADQRAGLRAHVMEYPIRSKDDYGAYLEVIRHTRFRRTYEAYQASDAAVGEAGLPMVILGPGPFHDWLMSWVGYEQGFYHLYDFPEVIGEVFAEAERVWRGMWNIAAESPAKLVMHGVNFDTSTTTPPLFREYFLPYYKPFIEQMHQAGIQVACHADGDSSGLLELIRRAGYDVADCFACAPMVRCPFEQAYQAWKGQITIWGGVPSSLIEPTVPLEQLERHLEEIFAAGREGRFILGLSDQALPSSSWEHIQAVSRALRNQKGIV